MKRCLILSLVLLFSISAFAQTLPTATLAGKVLVDDVGVPGVTVTLTSPNLQGSRTTVTTAQGDYIVPFLPPGEYTARYELSGMRTVTQKVTLTAARTNTVEVNLRPETIAESITVTANAPSVVETTQVSTNFNQNLIEELPVQRNLQSVTLLAPGVNPNGPGGNVMISGAMSFDSLYLVNGAVVNENLRGQAHDLFIEDAIQETTVMTAGVSAEYGHFTGGVVNAITKSGGNEFAGSFRTSLSNESWAAKTDFTEAQEDKINPVYEGTVGGPIVRDRIWFFGAGRFAQTEDIRQTVPGLARTGDQDANGNPLPVGTQLTPVTYPHSNEETRLEGKLTGSITPKHTVVASYLDIAESETNQTGQRIMDLDSLVAERQTPNTMLALNYSGVLTPQLFLEGQYSKKDFAFLNSGSPYFDNIKGTLITDRARGTRYWSPTFRASPGGEQRDIEVFTIKGTYFLSTGSFGSHELKAGYEDFNEVRKVNNYQNGSEFRISVPNTIVRGNTIYPRMPGGSSGTLTRISWLPIFVLSQGSDYTTRSLFLNDRWTLNNHLSFNLGVRYDKNDALSGARTFKIADDAAFSPRLAAQYDLRANGRLVLNASYGQYVGRLAEGAANDADPAGRSASFQWNYRGPSINNDVTAPNSALVPTEEAIRRVLDWFFANGGTDLRPFRTTPSVPGVESVLDVDGLKSPMVKEMSVGVASAIGSRGYVRADLILRNWDNFYTSYRDATTGQTQDDFGTRYDLAIIRSDNEIYDREYTGVQTQFSYRLLERLNLGGTYTWSRLVGNVIGENSGSGPLVGVAGEYPEYRREEWNYPTGYITGDQRNRAKIWAAYDVPTPVGDFNISLLQNFDSANRTSLDGSIDPRPYVTTGPDYLDPPASISYFFGGRGNLTTDDIFRTDLAVNYRLNLPAGIQLFVQPEVINVFNAQGVTSYDEEILTNADDDDLLPFNPFTEEPVEGVHWRRGPNFGKPTSEGDFQTPRTFRMSVGLRF